MNSSNSHSLSVWQCLVVYILEYKLFWLTVYKLYKFAIPKLSLFKIGRITAMCILVCKA